MGARLFDAIDGFRDECLYAAETCTNKLDPKSCTTSPTRTIPFTCTANVDCMAGYYCVTSPCNGVCLRK